MAKNTFLIIFTFIYKFFTGLFHKKEQVISSIHQFKVKTIDGKEFDLASLKGNRILIVNTASKCVFTPQFKDLQELYLKYKDHHFTILGFPCNQFNEQDPGTNTEIKEFCNKNFSVTFPLMEKIDVQGTNASEVYQWLTKKEKNGVMDSEVIWNFQKYMVDENGFLVNYVFPFKKPSTKKIIRWLEKKN